MAKRSLRDVKRRKQEEAEARQGAYGNLSLREKLDRLSSRPGQSKRERARLEKLLASQSKKGGQDG